MRLRLGLWLPVLVGVGLGGVVGCGGGGRAGAGAAGRPPTARPVGGQPAASAAPVAAPAAGRSVEQQHRIYHAALLAQAPLVVSEVELALGLEGAALDEFRRAHGDWTAKRSTWIGEHLADAAAARAYLATEMADVKLSLPRGFSPAEDHAHRLFQAAAVTGDNTVMFQVLIELGLADPSGRMSPGFQAFSLAHADWLTGNLGWIGATLGDPGAAQRWLMANSKIFRPPPTP